MLPFLAAVPAAAWAFLALARGAFWRSATPPAPTLPASGPALRLTAIVPARDEAATIQPALRSLLSQQLPAAALHIVLVDDNSTDGTGSLAAALLPHTPGGPTLSILPGQPLAPGWTGKLWAVHQGLQTPEARAADLILLTDADILHHPRHLSTLLAHAQARSLDLVSHMVRLRTVSLAERALIPAFVFFFQLLYPHRWVADPHRRTAAAAGGAILVRRSALDRIGGLITLRSALIDDVALARAIKHHPTGGPNHPILLQNTDLASSLREYPTLSSVVDMVARTAFVQLGYSPLALLGTTAGMAALYLAPVALTLHPRARRSTRLLGAAAWLTQAALFQPTLRRYRRSPLWGLALPAIAAVYTAATLLSALRFAQGRGAEWKNRTYAATG